MTPPGQNYPIAEHDFLFWGLYLGGVVTLTIALLGVFLIMVHRTSQATRVEAAQQVPAQTPGAAPAVTTAQHAETPSRPLGAASAA